MPRQLIDVVKHSGKRPSETFNRDKLHASVRAACLSVRSPEGEAEITARKVTDAVIIWLETKSEITSEDLRRMASHHLYTYHPDAAYLYEHHQYII